MMRLEAFENIDGGEHGQQIWSYAHSCEYLENNTSNPVLFLFDNRNEHNRKTIDPRYYALQKINIFIDNGALMVKKITSLTRWEIMEDSPDSEFIMLINDNTTSHDKTKQLLIEKKFLNVYLQAPNKEPCCAKNLDRFFIPKRFVSV